MPRKFWSGKFPWSEGIKKRACRYLLQRYLGQFLEEKLTLEQLSVDLYNGTGRVTDVSLDVQALNEMGEQQHLPLEFVDGFITEISVSIPWSAIFTEAGYVEVRGLKLTVQPRQRANTGTSMFESMWSSMTSSMQLAQECLAQDVNVDSGQPLEGIELFAQTIDAMLSRVKIRFLDTVIRLEHVPRDSLTGVAVEINIQNLEYSDEAGSDLGNIMLDSNQASKGYLTSAFMTKKFYLEGVNFYTDEFPSRARTFSRSIMTTSRDSTPDSKNSESQFSSAQISPSQNIPTLPESNIINSLCESNPILFAKLTGRQEVRLKIKQGGVLGPKVELEITLGSLTLFLSPRQLHVLIELEYGLASPDLEDTSNLAPKTYTEKPMANIDYSRVEKELIQKILPSQGLRTTDLKHTQSWSTAPLDEIDNEDVFLPMTLPGASSMCDSITSNNNRMEDSISTSSSISSKSCTTNISRQQKRKSSADSDLALEISQFHIGISSVAVLLLHEDILTTSIEGLGLTRASSKQMQNIAEEFFKKVVILTAGGYENKDFKKAAKLFLEACQLSHIRLLAAPLVVDGSEKTTIQMSVISGNLTLANIEIVECLIDSNNSNSDETVAAEFVELLKFSKDNSANSEFSTMTNLKMNFKRTQKAMRHAQLLRYTHPRTTIEIQLEPCKTELDITIVDRISAVLNPQPICSYNPINTIRDTINQQTLFYQAVESPLRDSRIDVKVLFVCHTLKVRFPIPDLRPVHDMNRTPWWKRNVRPDYVTLKLIDAQIHSTMESRYHCLARHEIQCRQVSLSYTENEGDIPVEIGRATTDEKTDSTLPQDEEGFDWPRMVITIYPKYFEGLLDDSSEGEELEHSFYGTALDNFPKHAPSPFSSKYIIHESDTPHCKYHGDDEEDGSEHRDGEELIIPGTRKEMLDFIEESANGSRIQLEIGLPCVSAQIPSKRLYELLYNRLNTDLFLWESSVPRPKSTAYMESNIGLDLASTVLQESINPRYSTCKSGVQHDSNSNSEEEEVFHSVTGKGDKKYQSKTFTNGQSMVSLTLNITQGILTMCTPVRDSLQNVIPGQQGELIIRLEEATMFSVSSYKGDPDLSYICAMVRNASLYHCELTTIPQQIPPLRSINSFIPKHYRSTIYPTETGAHLTSSSAEKDILTLAVRIQSAHQTHRIKTFRVTMGIRNATLRHRMSSSRESWFTQLIDCLDVVDHPVAGYLPPGVVTELHLHLWECAIDYRPIHLPLRTIITLGSFSISSNITAQTNTSTLRFMAEDAALFISDKVENIVDLRRDYVCVMDLGLFELSLRLNEKMSGGAPKIDLRASNNVLHVRTCSDSGRTLMQLLTYFANDGDLTPTMESVDNISIPSTGDEESLLGDQSINTLSKSQVDLVNSLIEEAMQESVKGSTVNTDEKSPEIENQVEVFFFPDEFHPTSQAESEMSTNPDLRDTRGYQASLEDPDEDFCILGDELGTGVVPKYGVPEVRWLYKETIQIVDNHFSAPLGKTDFLKAPKHYPSAVLRYTLCEMTLIWHMYGGNDFSNSPAPTKKHVIIDDGVHRHGDNSQGRSRSAVGAVSYHKVSPNEIKFGSVPNSPRAKTKEPSNWYFSGGPGRQKDTLMELQLNKVRFQHEVYPEHSSKASRQVLLVNEIEIRDRLASSCINKFLYQYSSETQPKQSHANMFVIKAVHIRPDPKLSAQECCLRLSLLPLRLNIDQDSLLFLIDFFIELTGNPKSKSNVNTTPVRTQSTPCSKHGTPTHRPPVMTVNISSNKSDEQVAIGASESSVMNQNLLILLEDELTIKEDKIKTKATSEPQVDNQPIYFRSVIFAPEVLVKLDYHGKRVDLTHGPLAGLLMGLAQLNCSELKLKRLVHRHGLLGVDKLLNFILSEWLQDIKKNQLHGLLGGVGPMHSLVQLFQGIQDLFWLPIEQYRKDGRIVRGLQRGANSFTTSTAMAVLELTSRLVQALQSTAETAYDMVSPGPSVKCKSNKGRKSHRKQYIQPLDIREGVTNAYILMKEGLGETATELVRVASEEHEQKGVTGAVGGVLRQIPPTVVKPIILASAATSNVLGGMRSQLVPDARREAVQKWRQDPQGV